MISGSISMSLLRKAVLLAALLLLPAGLWAGEWIAVGPDGGDVRSLAYDPHHPGHIYLGTSA